MADDQNLAWDRIRDLLENGDSRAELESFLDSLNPGDLLYAVFHLSADEQRALLSIISAERAAELIEEMPDSHVADLIEDMPADKVADWVAQFTTGGGSIWQG